MRTARNRPIHDERTLHLLNSVLFTLLSGFISFLIQTFKQATMSMDCVINSFRKYIYYFLQSVKQICQALCIILYKKLSYQPNIGKHTCTHVVYFCNTAIFQCVLSI